MTFFLAFAPSLALPELLGSFRLCHIQLFPARKVFSVLFAGNRLTLVGSVGFPAI